MKENKKHSVVRRHWSSSEVLFEDTCGNDYGKYISFSLTSLLELYKEEQHRDQGQEQQRNFSNHVNKGFINNRVKQ